MIDFHEISEKPSQFTEDFRTVQNLYVTLRPLRDDDACRLGNFLKGLSMRTREFFTYDSFDAKMAQVLCADINKYDKLRFILELKKAREIIGIFEFSMDLVKDDIERYASYGITLDVPNTCRYGPVLSDRYQGESIGSLVLSKLMPIIRSTGKSCIILFGGVKAGNRHAIKYYLKNGFCKAGEFVNPEGVRCFDMMRNI